MERSEQIGELVTALAKAQLEFTFASKESTNPAFNSKYADLAANIIAVRPALSKHGIALMQFDASDIERQTASVTTSIHHGEQWISVTVEAPAMGSKGFNVQSLGACWTYLRRYTLQALCGLASDDDDGNSLAVENKPITKKTEPSKGVNDTPIMQEESEHIKSELKRTERKASQLYEFLGQKPGSIIMAKRYGEILEWFKTPLMPADVSAAFVTLDFTPDEIANFCKSKGNDWDSILAQLNNMIGAKNE